MMDKKISFLSIQRDLIILLFFSQIFFLVSLGNISTLPLTIPFLIDVAFVAFSLLGLLSGKLHFSCKRLVIVLILDLTFLINAFMSSYGTNFSSLLLYIFYFTSFGLLDPRLRIENLNSLLKTFIIILSIASLYAIYQFFAYNFLTSLPFKEIIPQNLWTESYNTIQNVHGSLYGGAVVKAHSIYAEASSLSRYSAIALLLLFECAHLFKKRNLVLLMIINFISIAISLSGSGIIILFVGSIYYFFKVNSKGKTAILTGIIVLGIIYYFAKDSELLSYYIGRTDEFSTVNSSGYYRFVLPFKIGFENITSNFFGFGIGNDEIALSLYAANETGVANGYGKVFVELGLIGFIELLSLFVMLKPKNKGKNYSILCLLFVITLTMTLITNVLNPSIWAFVLLVEASKENYNSQSQSTKTVLIQQKSGAL